MAALGVGKVAEGSGVARDGSGRRDSGRSCGVAGASRSASGARIGRGGEELRVSKYRKSDAVVPCKRGPRYTIVYLTLKRSLLSDFVTASVQIL